MQSDLTFVYLSMKILQFLNPELQRASLVDIVSALSDTVPCQPLLMSFRFKKRNCDGLLLGR